MTKIGQGKEEAELERLRRSGRNEKSRESSWRRVGLRRPLFKLFPTIQILLIEG